eukprot:TRINITY_DN9121_c0_g1::TRINITY_DN9121_c0_g1_i1::g.12564::m.12564 TRINITY_DN9121_c0_g1::TRINITY_DN9121_c0_g1_i1::g.12564  ORF type:complete len:284 (+),score=22.34,Sec20/PF03908.8/5.1e+02,Sec20/PF03908.8/4.2e-16,Syntaxin/PF00804.20/0.43,Syntaxin/PF00804.20/1.5e+03 TRINITY_DN9121_c0_g1_i1:44-853(+)
MAAPLTDIQSLIQECKSAILQLSSEENDKLAFDNLCKDIKSLLRRLEISIQDAKDHADELDTEDATKQMLQQLDDIQFQHAQLVSFYRAEILNGKERIARIQQSEREELLRGSADVRQRKTLDGKAAVGKSRDITETLRRTREVMAQELERSSATSALIDEGSSTLNRTVDQHRTIDNSLGLASSLIRDLQKRDRLERVLLVIGIAFFSLVVLFILYRRLGALGMPIWGVFKLVKHALGFSFSSLNNLQTAADNDVVVGQDIEPLTDIS